MKILILGSASGLSVTDRNPSSYLLQTKQCNYLIDAGDGVAHQLVRYNVNPLSIDSVFITHTHSDHASGIFMLLQWMHLNNRKKRLRIFIPEGLLPGFNSIFPFFHIFRESWPFLFDLLPIAEGSVFNEQKMYLSAIVNTHLQGNQSLAEKANLMADSYSFEIRYDNDLRILYSSDVVNLDHLKNIEPRLNIFLCESTHVLPEEAIRFALNHNVQQLIFTHIPPDMEDKKNIYAKKSDEHLLIHFAMDGQIIEV